jgi:hypothetical protein
VLLTFALSVTKITAMADKKKKVAIIGAGAAGMVGNSFAAVPS